VVPAAFATITLAAPVNAAPAPADAAPAPAEATPAPANAAPALPLLREADDMIREADSDGDGMLSLGDFTSAVLDARIAFEGEASVNNDGECMCHMGNVFTMIDANADARVSSDELHGLLNHLDNVRTQRHGLADVHASRQWRTRRQMQRTRSIPAGDAPMLSDPTINVGDGTPLVGASSVDHGAAHAPGNSGHGAPVSGPQPNGVYFIPGGSGGVYPEPGLTVYPPYRTEQGPVLRARYDGQSKFDRWQEVWGVRHGVPVPRSSNAPHNKPVPSWSSEHAALRDCVDDPPASLWVTPGTGSETTAINCPCLTSYPSGVSLNGAGNLIVEISGVTYEYPSDYGLGCQHEDDGLPPFCDVTPPRPGWCTQHWCYVDQANCNVVTVGSSYVPGIEFHYSYEACVA